MVLLYLLHEVTAASLAKKPNVEKIFNSILKLWIYII